MSTCTIHSPIPVADFAAKRAARRAVARPLTVPAVDALPTRPAAADAESPNPAGDSQILRRWSVAELIAAATSSRAAA